MNEITRIGIGLGKNTLHFCAMDRSGRVVLPGNTGRTDMPQA